MEPRLPAHLEVAALMREVQSQGGFAAVIHKGERDAGTILVVLTENGEDSRAYERMPQLDGTRGWTLSIRQDADNKPEFSDFLLRRASQDPDLWIIELDIAYGERFLDISDISP